MYYYHYYLFFFQLQHFIFFGQPDGLKLDRHISKEFFYAFGIFGHAKLKKPTETKNLKRHWHVSSGTSKLKLPHEWRRRDFCSPKYPPFSAVVQQVLPVFWYSLPDTWIGKWSPSFAWFRDYDISWWQERNAGISWSLSACCCLQ